MTISSADSDAKVLTFGHRASRFRSSRRKRSMSENGQKPVARVLY
jgi:hypothetical protein